MADRVLSPVLVGRDGQLALLEGALLDARRGEGRLVVLVGEAGIGKTRLANELAQEARRLGCAVLWGSCSEADLSLPFLPFVEAVGNYLAVEDVQAFAARLGPIRRDLAQLFPQLWDEPVSEPTIDPAQAKLRLFEAIVALLAAAASERALVLVVEDVHWADDSTRELLDHLARRLTGSRILLVVSYRSDELHRRHASLPLIQTWRRSRLAETVTLEPLSPAGVAEMIGAIFDTDEVGEEFGALMHERTEGNPFVLEEMLKEATERGDIFRTETGWDRRPIEELRIPDTVRDSILLRLGRLEPGQVTVLQAAAVLGRRFAYGTLLAVSDLGEDAVQAALEAAIRLQLVEEQPDEPGRYRWRHALTQEAIYTDMVTPRRQRIHARAADALAAEQSTPLVDLAHHLLGAGRFAEAVPVCLESADEAERAVAFREAVSLLEHALLHIAQPEDRARVLCRIGRVYWLNGESAMAEQFLAEGVESLEALGEALEAARFRVVLGRCHWERAEPELARADFERARDVLETAGPSAELAVAYMRIAGLHAFELDYEACLKAARRASEIAEAAGADFERVWALTWLALGLFDAGDVQEGFDTMDLCFAEAKAKGYWLIAQNVTYNDLWTRVQTMQGDLETRLERLAALPSVPTTAASLVLGTSYVMKVRGDLPGARDEAERGLVLYEYVQLGKMLWRWKVQIAEVLVEMRLLDEAASVLPPLEDRSELQDTVYDAPAQIRYRLARGDLDAALALAREILSCADRLGLYRETLAVAAEAFVAGGYLDEAQVLIDAGRSRPAAAGSAFLDEAQGRVLLARGDLVDARGFLRSAVSEAGRFGFRLAELRSRLLLAQTGSRDEAAGELETVFAEADRCRARLIHDAAKAVAVGLGLPVPTPAEIADPGEGAGTVVLGERLVTVLFADIRGYSALAASVAPEELAERMASLYRLARAEVERHYGIVDKFAGDAVMATFNVAGSRLDHSAHALEAAFALRDRAALVDLQLGIGIAVGPAVIARGASDDNIAVRGVATNLAARLQAAAGEREIVISDDAHRRVERWLLERGIAAEREELALKGFDAPQVGYRIV